MPLGPRVRSNNVYGTVSDNPLLIGAVSFTSLGLSLLPSISAQHAVIVLDPKRAFGEPEIVVVTSHLAMGTTATITRGQYGTTARQHPAGTTWAHVPINEDYITVATSTTRPLDPYTGELIFETDTVIYKFWNGATWVSINSAAVTATLAYAEVTANQLGLGAGPTDLTSLSVTVTVPAGRRLRITGHGQFSYSDTTTGHFVDVLEDGTTVGRAYLGGPIGTSGFDEMDGAVIRTPSAGTHTYKLTASRYFGAGTGIISAGSGNAAYIHVEDVTSSEFPFSNPSVPVGVLGQGFRTSSTTTSGTTALTTITGVNVTVPAGRILKINYFEQNVSGTVTADNFQLDIQRNGVAVQSSIQDVPSGNDNFRGPHLLLVESPPAGSHTYTAVVTRTSGTGTLTLAAAAASPAILVVQDVTPTPTASPGAPSATLGYNEVLTNQGTFTAETDLTGLAVTVTVPAGRRLRIASKTMPSSSVANDEFRLLIKEGATTLQSADEYSPTVNAPVTLDSVVIISPTAGTHTYKLAMLRQAGTGNITNNASATFPSYILVEDITGALFPAATQVTSGLIASEVWTPYTGAAPTPTGGTFTTVTGSGRFIKLGRIVHYEYKVTVTTVGTASGDILFDLPVAAEASFRAFGSGRENGVVGTGLWVYSSTPTRAVIQTGAAIANSKIYDVAGTYEAAS